MSLFFLTLSIPPSTDKSPNSGFAWGPRPKMHAGHLIFDSMAFREIFRRIDLGKFSEFECYAFKRYVVEQLESKVYGPKKARFPRNEYAGEALYLFETMSVCEFGKHRGLKVDRVTTPEVPEGYEIFL